MSDDHDTAGLSFTFGPLKTKAAVRTVPLPSFVCDELSRRAVPPVDPEGLVFQSSKDSRSGRRSFVDASGVQRLPQPDSNHSASTISDTPPSRSGSLREPTPKHVAAMAGHTSVSVVLDRYGHLYPQQDDELMQRLASRAGVPHVGLGGG